jgi:gliding motility-associated-like protein
MKLPLGFLLVFCMSSTFAQRGSIIVPASTTIMDPNQDGYVSKTTAGFSNDGYYVDEFEIPMFGIPKLGGDVLGDNVGQPCGITDLIPDSEGYSVYAVRDANNNLIFRFRVGRNNPSVEAWTILLDADGLFGASDPNATAFNPGFEIDITLIKRNNAGVLVYNIDGVENCPQPLLNYPLSSNFQIAVADEVSCGDADYFYDFFVPFAEIAAALGIDENTGLRYVAVTNVSATCAMDGKIADISGVDYGDYEDCVPCAFTEIIESQCPTAVVDLCETCEGFNAGFPTKPTIDEPIRAGQTEVCGTSEPGTYIKLSVYSRTGGTDDAPVWSDTPREEHVVFVPVSDWCVTLNGPLLAYDRIVARAQLNADGTGCGSASGNEASTSVTVVEPNVAPVAQDQVVEVIEDTPKDIVLVGTDADGDPITYTIVTPPVNGVLTGTGANVTYTPDQDYFGPDSFTFTVNDGVLTSNMATVTITVTPVNDAPIAVDDAFSTDQNVPLNASVAGNDSDVDGPSANYTLVTGPTHGNLVLNPDGSFTYTPDLDFNGSDQFVYSLCDGGTPDLCDNATVAITVNPGNSAPVAVDDTFVTDEDTPLNASVAGNDNVTDGPEAIYSVVSNPTNGVLIINTDGTFTYTPNLDYNGTDQFVYSLCDGGTPNLCDNATVTITINPVNDPPIAVDDAYVTEENTPLNQNVSTNDSDVDGPEANYTLVSGPSFGALVLNADGTFSYTPDTDYIGTDQFVYSLCDGGSPNLCDQATVTIVVITAIGNNAPVAIDDDFITDEDTPLNASVAGNDFDVDGPGATYSLVSGTTNGILVFNPDGSFTYSPDLNFNGTDQFGYTLCDGGTPDLCDNAIAIITVRPVNDPPVVQDITVDVDEDSTTKICITVTDIEGDPSELTSAISLLGNGTAVLDTVGGQFCFLYTPNPNYNGQDQVVVTVCDVNEPSVCGTGTVTINILPVNDPPVIVVGPTPVDSLFFTTPEDVPLDFCFDFMDVDGDDTSLDAVVNLAGGGVLDFDMGSQYCFTFTPVLNFNGKSIWDISICDDGSPSLCGKVIVVIDVLPIDDPPVAVDDVFETDEDVVLNANVASNDINDGPQTNYTLLTGPTNGSLVLNANGTFTYTPNLNYFGPDGFTYRLCDGSVPDQCDDATVSITVHPVNDPPVIAPFPVLETKEDSLLQVCVSVTDVDGDIITYEAASNVKGGGAMVLDEPPFNFCYIFTPSLNYNGESIWNISVNDGTVSVMEQVKIIVLPVNDPPVAANDYYTVRSGVDTAFNALTNDLPIVAPFKEFYDIYEADSVDNLTLTHILSGPFHGTATFQPGGAIQYKSNFMYTGPDSLRYRVCDSGNLCDTAVVFIEVTLTPFKIWEAFSPNGDGLNEYWRIDGIEAFPNNRVRVFDRYGNMVYETRGYRNPENNNGNDNTFWRGQSNHGLISGKVPEGTYFYSVELGDGSAVLSGYVLLKLK